MSVRKLGEQFGRGLIDAAVSLFAYGMAGFAIVVIVQAVFDLLPRDSTDSPSSASGMKLRTDHLTGCQYLESHDGFLTPRLGRDGRPLCGATA